MHASQPDCCVLQGRGAETTTRFLSFPEPVRLSFVFFSGTKIFKVTSGSTQRSSFSNKTVLSVSEVFPDDVLQFSVFE